MTDDPARRGRPSVAHERRSRIVDAYLELLAEAPTITVRMHEVATRAGISRTAIAHFVGDRDQLHVDAVLELQHRYETMLRAAFGPEPTPDDIVDVLFSTDWTDARTNDDRAFDHFVLSASSNPTVAGAVRHAYTLLIDELTEAIQRSIPGTTRNQAAAIAYPIVCIAESNSTLQDLGFPQTRSKAARNAAYRLLKPA